MTESQLYPLLFEPVLKDYVWGGRELATRLGRDLPPGVIAESWDIAAHANGTSVVANGPLAGMTLTQLHGELGYDLIGHNSRWAQQRNKFPLLVKLLDAHQRLSVQVHPDDAYATAHEDNELGKTEMWVVLHAKPGASLILGVRRGTSPTMLRQAIQDNQVESLLHKIAVKSRDFICVPSGSLHAILGGIVLVEIQQNSDVTYRVYDWGRNDPNRPLHVDKALSVINFEQEEPALQLPPTFPAGSGISRERLCQNRYFTVERLTLQVGAQYEGSCNGDTMEIWGTLEGRVTVTGGPSTINLSPVAFTLLPAMLGRFLITAVDESTLLRTYVGKC